MAKRPVFTEGPWAVEWRTDNDGDPYFDIIKQDADVDDYGRSVNASYSIVEMAYPVIDEEIARANGQLIAAAPDLYEALVRLRKCLDVPGDMSAAIRNADMTLAYARGENWYPPESGEEAF